MASALQEVGTRWRMGCRRRSWCVSDPPRPVQSSLGAEEPLFWPPPPWQPVLVSCAVHRLKS